MPARWQGPIADRGSAVETASQLEPTTRQTPQDTGGSIGLLCVAPKGRGG